MVEIRIELVEVDSPGGEIIGTPLAAGRSNMLDVKDSRRLWQTLVDEIDKISDY